MRKSFTIFLLVILMFVFKGYGGNNYKFLSQTNTNSKSVEIGLQFTKKYIAGDTVQLHAIAAWSDLKLKVVKLNFPDGSKVTSANQVLVGWNVMNPVFGLDSVQWEYSYGLYDYKSPIELDFSLVCPNTFAGDLAVAVTFSGTVDGVDSTLTFNAVLNELSENPSLVLSTESWFSAITQVSSTVTSESEISIYNDGVQNLVLSEIQNLKIPFGIKNELPVTVRAQETEPLLFSLNSLESGFYTNKITLASNGSNKQCELNGAVYDSTYEVVSFLADQFPPVGWQIEDYGNGSAWKQYGSKLRFSSYDNLDSSSFVSPTLDLSKSDNKFIGFNLTVSTSINGILNIEYLIDGDSIWKTLKDSLVAPMAENGDTYISLNEITASKAKIRLKALVENEYFDISTLIVPGYFVPEAAPLFTQYNYPASEIENVSLQTEFSWNKALYAEGYKLFLDTLPNPVAFFDLGDTTQFQIDLNELMYYYWKVVPYNMYGDAIDCPIWSFKTEQYVPTAFTKLSSVNNKITFKNITRSSPKVAMTSTGKTFITWFVLENGNYNMKIQILDKEGHELLRRDGAILSSHKSSSWLTDYSLIVDADDNALVSFIDNRIVENDAVIYKVSDTGEMLWGENGINLTESIEEPAFTPVIKLDSVGNVYVKVDILPQATIFRLNKNGNKLLDSTYINNNTLLDFEVGKNGDSYITYYSGGKLYFDILDTLMISKLSEPAVLSTNPGFPYYGPKYVDINIDKHAGAYVVWRCYQSNKNSAKWQYVDISGVITQDVEGKFISTNDTRKHNYPKMQYSEDNDNLLIVWDETLSSTIGLFAQIVDKEGNESFDEAGKIIIDVCDSIAGSDAIVRTGDTLMLFYSTKINGSTSKNNLDVLFLTENIDSVTNESWKRYGSTITKKVMADICYNDSMVVTIWNENRDDENHYYTQNVFIDGQMGILGADTVPPVIVNINVLSNTKLQILFNEPLYSDSAEQISAYTLNNDTNIVIEKVELLHSKELIIWASGIKEGVNTLYLKNVTDLLLNVNPLDSVNFQFIPDTVYPEIITLKPVANDKIVIRFSEPVAERFITSLSNYELSSGQILKTKVISADQVLLYTTNLIEQEYQLKIQKYTDYMENTVDNEVYAFTFTFNTGNLVYFDEDFSDGIPNTFELYDLDQNTPISELTAFTQAWIPIELNNGNTVAASTSSYKPAGRADDWMITSKIVVKKSPYLFWDARAINPEFPDGYEVWASIKGNQIEDFAIKIFEIGEEHYTWRYRNVDLSDFGFGDDTLYIAFRNHSNNRYVLNIDNVELYTPQSTDVAIANTLVPNQIVSAGIATVDFYVENRGVSTIKSVNINYSFNNGEVKTQFVDSIHILRGETLHLYHANKLQLPVETGIYRLQLWASEPNGNTDENLYNDTLTLHININESYPRRMVLLEHFTNTDCGPCAIYNPDLEQLLATNNNAENVMHITYHVNWPGANDPFYLANPDDVFARKELYHISGVPGVAVNGNKAILSPNQISQQIIDKENIVPGLVKIDGSAQFALNNSDLTIDFNMSNLTDFSAKSPAVFVILAQNHEFEIAPGGNGETYFPGVMHKILPSNTGELLDNLDSLAVNNFKYNYTMPDDVELDKAFLGIIIQDTATNKVYMAAKLPMIEVGIAEAKVNEVSLYPNPANSYINIKANATIKVLKVVDISGKVVLQLNADNNHVGVDLSELANGYYMVMVKTVNGVSTHQIVVEQ